MWIFLMLFWVGATGLLYIYGGYPLGVWLWARLCPRPVKKSPFVGSISVVIVAHNEESVLPGKLASLLNSEGASRVSEILVASDGSSDHTTEVAALAGDDRVRVLAYPTRRGKAAVLNELIPQCANEMVVLTDARQKLHPQALVKLLCAFADPEVGVVSGSLVLNDSGDPLSVGSGLVGYWNYEKIIRWAESRVASVPGATGAFYAIRKSLFREIPEDSLLDDVAIPMQIVMQGYRCVFEKDAEVYDRASAEAQTEAIRKRRTLAGNLQLVRDFPKWLVPWRNPIWVQFVSHKLMRLLTPFLLTMTLLGSWALRENPFYEGCLWLQLAFWGMLLCAVGLRRLGKRFPGQSFLQAFLLFNGAILAAWGDALLGRFEVRWKR